MDAGRGEIVNGVKVLSTAEKRHFPAVITVHMPGLVVSTEYLRYPDNRETTVYTKITRLPAYLTRQPNEIVGNFDILRVRSLCYVIRSIRWRQ